MVVRYVVAFLFGAICISVLFKGIYNISYILEPEQKAPPIKAPPPKPEIKKTIPTTPKKRFKATYGIVVANSQTYAINNKGSMVRTRTFIINSHLKCLVLNEIEDNGKFYYLIRINHYPYTPEHYIVAKSGVVLKC